MANREPMIYCEYEQQEFPAAEFEEDEEWGRVHSKAPRHTVRGYVIGAHAHLPDQMDAEEGRDMPGDRGGGS